LLRQRGSREKEPALNQRKGAKQENEHLEADGRPQQQQHSKRNRDEASEDECAT
jgi:hypothetical protein